ncbi:hypothetical protein [Chryseolinea sp. H1M3-3]|uniref:hypothetical protein n=1 Tax=Chryseolinea sp. H1M3-3 TaxID=3034144 RepID=UPI0023ED26FD|nr:hypothetical protein [Chryseolinea sp. H1M3-3]
MRQIATIGAFSSHNVVNTLLHNLEKMGKIQIKKNVKKLTIGEFESRKCKGNYFKNGFVYARTSSTFKIYNNDYWLDYLKEEEQEKIIQNHLVKVKKLVRKKITYTPPSELVEKFYLFISENIKTLISFKVLGSNYLTRKVSIPMFSKILKKCLFQPELKDRLSEYLNLKSEIIKFQKEVTCLYLDPANFTFMKKWSSYGKKYMAAYKLGYADESNNIYAKVERFERDQYIKQYDAEMNGTSDIVLTTWDWSKVYVENNVIHQSI